MTRKWKYLYQDDIPEWIKGSPYLQSLLENGPLPKGGLQVPKWCLKRDTSIKCYDDALSFLRTARYWLLPDETISESKELICYFLGPNSSLLSCSLIKALEQEHPILAGLFSVVKASLASKVKFAVRTASLCILTHLCESLQLQVTEDAARAAISGNHVHCLKYIHSKGLALNDSLTDFAASEGSMECLEYLHQSGAPLSILGLFASTRCLPGQLECLKYLLQQDIPYFHITLLQAHCARGVLTDTATIDVLVEHYGAGPIPNAIFSGAAKAGRLTVLKHCIAKGYPIYDTDVLLGRCAAGRNFECLQYLHSCNFQLSARTIEEAARGGDISCIRFLLENGCPTSHSVCRILAELAYLKCLQYVRSVGLAWDASTCTAAAGCGSLECLVFAHENGCPWDEHTCEAAARAGHLMCLKYAHENGCPWKINDTLCRFMNMDWISGSAACAPTADCLRYVVERGAPVRKEAVNRAAGANCIDSLEFLHSLGCLWDASTCKEAVGEGAIESLRYLHERGCPWDEKVSEMAWSVRHNRIKYTLGSSLWKKGLGLCMEYLKEHNCPGANKYQLVVGHSL